MNYGVRGYSGEDITNYSIVSKSIISFPYKEKYSDNIPFNKTRVIGSKLTDEVNKFKTILDCVLNKNETYFDFSSMNYYYALVERINPLYVNQSPLQLCDDFTQQVALEQFKNGNAPVVAMPNRRNPYMYLDGIAVDYKFYMISEYIYDNYQPIIRLENIDIYFRKDKIREYVRLLNDNGIVNEKQYIANGIVPEKWERNLGHIPYLWGEKDAIIDKIKIQECNKVVEAEGYIFKFFQVQKMPTIFIIEISSNENCSAILKAYDSHLNISPYRFNIKKGTKKYVFRISADYIFWATDNNEYVLNTTTPVSIVKAGLFQTSTGSLYTPKCDTITTLAEVNDGGWNYGVGMDGKRIILNYSKDLMRKLDEKWDIRFENGTIAKVIGAISDGTYIIVSLDTSIVTNKHVATFPSRIELFKYRN